MQHLSLDDFLKHYQLQMDVTLYNLLLDISSDMGIFLTQGNLLLVEGRGEKITPLKIDVKLPHHPFPFWFKT